MAHTQAHDLEALCATCPSAEEVTSLLQAVGFALTFHMDAVPSACIGVPPFSSDSLSSFHESKIAFTNSLQYSFHRCMKAFSSIKTCLH